MVDSLGDSWVVKLVLLSVDSLVGQLDLETVARLAGEKGAMKAAKKGQLKVARLVGEKGENWAAKKADWLAKRKVGERALRLVASSVVLKVAMKVDQRVGLSECSKAAE